MIADQVILLNETTLECINELDENKIVKNFTDVGLKVFGADFGFVWIRRSDSSDLTLVYKSPNLPFTPLIPRKNGRNYNVLKSSKPDFVTYIKKRPNTSKIRRHIKSFVIIPIVYKQIVYGNVILCFKKREFFTREKRILSTFIGNSVAQTITISRLILDKIESQKKAMISKNLVRLLREEKQKTEFIANATHELRTPLAIIKGNVDLSMQKKPKSAIAALRAIDSEIKHLSNLLEDLSLMTSKSQKFNNKFAIQKVDLKSLITTVITRCKALAFRKNIKIISDRIPSLIILGDRVYLEKMLINLIKNSIIYGHQNGHTRIVAKKTRGRITINVVDDGIGISKEDLPYVFERFYRADKSHSSNGHSTGLGLAIVKWVAELHGGTASVKQNKDGGSNFQVSIPANKYT